jgi:hypothetical protein
MKKTLLFTPLLATMVLLGSSGCELVTQESPIPPQHPANHLVINEVFTLPLDNPGTYSWIEFFNPTADTIDLTKWTLSMHSYRLDISFGARVELDTSTGGFRILGTSQTIFLDSIGVFNVPFGEGLFSVPGVFAAETTRVLPGKLLTIVNNEARMLDHTNWGPPEQGEQRELRHNEFGLGSVFLDSIYVFRFVQDTIIGLDTVDFAEVRTKGYAFLIQPEDQLVLKNPSGKVVDVVRIGNYVAYQPTPFTDPNGLLGSQNHAIPRPPDFQSVCRYADAYFTGNTANDFFITTNTIPPTPGAYSQPRKQ